MPYSVNDYITKVYMNMLIDAMLYPDEYKDKSLYVDYSLYQYILVLNSTKFNIKKYVKDVIFDSERQFTSYGFSPYEKTIDNVNEFFEERNG